MGSCCGKFARSGRSAFISFCCTVYGAPALTSLTGVETSLIFFPNQHIEDAYVHQNHSQIIEKKLCLSPQTSGQFIRYRPCETTQRRTNQNKQADTRIQMNANTHWKSIGAQLRRAEQCQATIVATRFPIQSVFFSISDAFSKSLPPSRVMLDHQPLTLGSKIRF